MTRATSFVNGVPINQVPVIQVKILKTHLEESFALQAGEVVWVKENLANEWIARRICQRLPAEVKP